MHTTTKVGSFMALRANGWSLDKIAKKINVSKTTLWRWDIKSQNEIHVLKHMQLERVQEQYLPTYEEELKSLATQLARVEEALGHQDLSSMPPAFRRQISLQIRDRLSKIRQQAPLRTIQYGPVEPLPVTGCITKDEDYPWVDGDPAIEAAEDAADAAEAGQSKPSPADPADQDPTPGSVGPAAQSVQPPASKPAPAKPSSNGHTSGPRVCDPQHHPDTNGKPHLNGHSNGTARRDVSPDSTIQRSNNSTSPIRLHTRSSVVQNRAAKKEQKGTKKEGGENSDRSPSTTYKTEN